MSTIDQSTDPTPLTWDEQCEIALTEWRRHQDAALAAHQAVMRILSQRPEIALDRSQHVELFVADVQGGDQILWDGHWWHIARALHGDDARPWLADSVLFATRVRATETICLAGNTVLTVVRAGGPATCTGERYQVNPSNIYEGFDIHHDGPCPLHPEVVRP